MPPKKKSSKILKKAKPAKVDAKDPRIEEVYEETVYFNCPTRGRIAQKVKIKKFKSLIDQSNQKHILDSKDPLDRIESNDDGLSIYNDGDDLGITGDKEE